MADQIYEEQMSLFPEGEVKEQEPEIIDLDLSITKRKKFRFDKDDNRIVELNTSDMGILERIAEIVPKLNDLQLRASKIMDGVNLTENNFEDAPIVAERLKAVDTEMREYIDYLFDAPVSEKAAPDGSMYDPFNGSFRYEHILVLLIQQYGDNISSEYKKIEQQIEKHTNKYKK